jgi:transposase-like protein
MGQGKKPEKPKTRLEELEAENRRLLRENRVLLMERDILKKAATWFAKESE